jgi:aryl-alcohol dehydrogenase-like predicted oxidoreductase
MNTRKLGKNGPELTEVGLGTYAIGGKWLRGWGNQKDNDSNQAINKALDLGINWIDTAPIYGIGHAEEIIGRALWGRRESVFIATKCGRKMDKNGNLFTNNKAAKIRKELETSLYRLKTDYIDLYIMHSTDPKIPIEETWQLMVDLKTEGKVRYIGVSNFNKYLIEKCQAVHHVDVVQPPYNIMNRNIETDVLPYCMEQGIGVLVCNTLQSGLFSGAFDMRRLSHDDWRRKNPMFRDNRLVKNLALMERLRPIASKYEKTIGQFLIAWALTNPAVSAAIVGAREAKQVEEIVGGSGWQPSAEDLAAVIKDSDELIQEFGKQEENN